MCLASLSCASAICMEGMYPRELQNEAHGAERPQQTHWHMRNKYMPAVAFHGHHGVVSHAVNLWQ